MKSGATLAIPGEPSRAASTTLAMDEAALIRAAQAGDQDAFERLVRDYDQSVLRLAMNLLRSPDDAHDVYQEAFLRVYRNLHNFRFDCNFNTWLYRIVTNLCLDHLRKKKVRKTESAVVETEEGPIDRLDSVPEQRASSDPQRALLSRELRGRIHQVLPAQYEKFNTPGVLFLPPARNDEVGLENDVVPVPRRKVAADELHPLPPQGRQFPEVFFQHPVEVDDLKEEPAPGGEDPRETREGPADPGTVRQVDEGVSDAGEPREAAGRRAGEAPQRRLQVQHVPGREKSPVPEPPGGGLFPGRCYHCFVQVDAGDDPARLRRELQRIGSRPAGDVKKRRASREPPAEKGEDFPFHREDPVVIPGENIVKFHEINIL